MLANHATDPVPISTTIRKCASEFKKVRLYVTLAVVGPDLPLLSSLIQTHQVCIQSHVFGSIYLNFIPLRTLGTRISWPLTRTSSRTCLQCWLALRTVRDMLLTRYRPCANLLDRRINRHNAGEGVCICANVSYRDGSRNWDAGVPLEPRTYTS